MTPIFEIVAELEQGINHAKCQRCGCMQETVAGLESALPDPAGSMRLLKESLTTWRQRLQPVEYACLGCDPCFPAVALNRFSSEFPEIDLPALGCDFQMKRNHWPPVSGEYHVVSTGAPVAVSTLASVALARDLAHLAPIGLAICGKTETENIGIDKLIKNVITNPTLTHLIICGVDSEGHQTGRTLLALVKNGVDAGQRVIGSPGKRPVLHNVTPAEIEAFCRQVELVDLIGCVDPAEICATIETLATETNPDCGCSSCGYQAEPAVEISTPVVTVVNSPDEPVALDRRGYFVIIPRRRKKCISVEYYDYDHRLHEVLEGQSARSLYLTIIKRGWISELSHAAYLGKELARAELALQHNLTYVQDGA
jgi:tetrahydromethanopterin S-methyltransferase subunit A